MSKIILSAFLVVLGLLVGYVAGLDTGILQERKRQAQVKAEHDTFMKGLGVCEWSEAMARQVSCGGQP